MRQTFPVSAERQLSADELHEILRAEVKLADLDLYEEVARAVETEPLSAVREVYAAQYREYLGISVDQRDVLRAALERIQGGGGDSVANVVQRLNT